MASNDFRVRLTTSLLADLVVPLALCCGLRAIGVDQWLALLVGESLPVARLGYTLITRHRLGAVPICALAVAVGAHLIG